MTAVGHEVAAEQQILAIAQQIRHQLLQPFGQRLGILRRAPALQREQNDGIALGVNVDLELFCLLVNFRHAQGAGGDLFKELAAGKLLIFRPFLLEAAQIVLLFSLLVDFPADILQRLQQRRLCHGLEQVLLHADLNGLLRELKIVVSADEDDPCLRQLGADELAERQPVHKRHFDIRDQNVRAQLADLRQGKLPVGASPQNSKPYRSQSMQSRRPSRTTHSSSTRKLQQCDHLNPIVPFFPGVWKKHFIFSPAPYELDRYESSVIG